MQANAFSAVRNVFFFYYKIYIVEYSIIDSKKREQIDNFVLVPGQRSRKLFFFLYNLHHLLIIIYVVSQQGVKNKNCFSALPHHLPASSIVQYKHHIVMSTQSTQNCT